MSFTGFSEDDIRKLTNNASSTGDKAESLPSSTTLKNGNFRKAPPKNYKKQTTESGHLKNPSADYGVIPESALLNRMETTVSSHLKNTSDDGGVIPKSALLNKMDILRSNVTETEQSPALQVSNIGGDEDNSTKCNDVIIYMPEKRFLDLEEFQARQKCMEEQNRKRKELLAKALADRTKQTQEEVEKLSSIRDELKRLDAILSNDVKILRSQIETASLEYMEAQKRYSRVEKEFLDAKLMLHQKLERKEMLTEHLCAIIEKNEERKAEKLTALLQKLNISAINCTVGNDEINNESEQNNPQVNDISSSSDINNSNSA